MMRFSNAVVSGLAGVAGFVSVLGVPAALAQPACPGGGEVAHQHRVTQFAGGFTGVLNNSDFFGISVEGAGDLDGDGIPDLLVGAHADDDDGFDRGAVWLLYMNPSGTVKAHQKVSQTFGGFEGLLTRRGNFGRGIAVLGDAGGDGRLRLAVGALAVGSGEQSGEIWTIDLDVCRSLPIFSVQPEGVLVDGSGGLAMLSAQAQGTGTPFYQWRKDGVELRDGGPISGSETDTLTVFVDGDDVGLYDVVASNAFGDRISQSVIVALREGSSACRADFDGDGSLTIFDFLAFSNAFDMGCP